MDTGVQITTTGTGVGAGNITLNGIAGRGNGVELATGLISVVDGNISITATGTGPSNGLFLQNNADITSIGTGAEAGNIIILGTAGVGTCCSAGAKLRDATSSITTVDGDITITGIGNADGTQGGNTGINLENGADIISTGTGADAGTITLIGTGGDGLDTDHGIYLKDAGSTVTAVDGAITLTGTGGAGAFGNNHGIYLDNSTGITSTGQANITLTGEAGQAASSRDITIANGANTIGGGAATGNITFSMDNLSLAALTVQTAGDITLQPRTAGRTVGVAGGAGDLNLSAAVLNMMTAGDEMIIGRVNGTGAMHVNARNWSSGLHLRGASGVINIDGNQDVGADNFTITSDADPVVVGALTGTGTLTLQQASAATTMGVAGGAGALNYSLADIAALGAGWTALRLGSPTATGALTVGANAWDNPVEYRAAAGGSIVITASQTSVAASDARFTFSGPATLGANVSTAAATGGTQDITFSDDVTLTGNTQVLAGNGDISVAGTVDGAFDLTLSAAGTIALLDDVGAGTPLDDLTITSDADPTIGGDVAGTGILTLQQLSNATTMGVAGGAGALNYSAADLAGLGAGWASMRFGSTTATGALTVGANAWSNPVQYRSAAAGSIVITGAQTSVAASDTTFTFSGPISLGANVSTAAATGGVQDITFSDDVTLTANTQVLAGNGDIAFAGTIDGAFDLTLSAAGTITLSDDVGAGTPLDDLTITSDADPSIGGDLAGTGILTLQQLSNATTMGVAGGAGALNYSAADLAGLGAAWTSVRLGSPTATGALTVGAKAWAVPVDYRAAAAGSIVISGAQTAVAASDTIFTFSGPATINAPLDLTNATGGTQAITFNDSAAVNADITSDGGDVTFSGTLSLGADIATGGGDITLADDVTLTGIGSIDTGAADILFAGTIDGAFDLTLTTTGDITFADDVGGTVRLGDVVLDPRHVTAAGLFNAASFTLFNGTGNVDFSGATGLNATGGIDIDTDGNILGLYEGATGILGAGTGAITATVSFGTLDIDGAAATLSAGYMGSEHEWNRKLG